MKLYGVKMFLKCPTLMISISYIDTICILNPLHYYVFSALTIAVCGTIYKQ